MPIDVKDVVVGGVYVSGKHLRKVTKIEEGKVHYMRKSPTRGDWEWGHTKATPPSLENFAEACDSKKED